MGGDVKQWKRALETAILTHDNTGTKRHKWPSIPTRQLYRYKTGYQKCSPQRVVGFNPNTEQSINIPKNRSNKSTRNPPPSRPVASTSVLRPFAHLWKVSAQGPMDGKFSYHQTVHPMRQLLHCRKEPHWKRPSERGWCRRYFDKHRIHDNNILDSAKTNPIIAIQQTLRHENTVWRWFARHGVVLPKADVSRQGLSQYMVQLPIDRDEFPRYMRRTELGW